MEIKDIAQNLRDQRALIPSSSAIKYGRIVPKKRQNLDDSCYWTADRIKPILQDEIYVGKVYYDKDKGGKRQPKEEWQLSPYQVPTTISQKVFDQAQTLLKRKKKRMLPQARREDHHFYLLSGLIRCGHCESFGKKSTWQGLPKKVKSSNTTSYYYQCGQKGVNTQESCSTIPIPAEQFEKYITTFVKALVSDYQLVRHLNQKMPSYKLKIGKLRKDELRVIKQLNNLPDRKQRIDEMYEMGELRQAEYQKRKQNINKEEMELKLMLDSLRRELSQNEIADGYDKTFKQLNNIDEQTIQEIFNDQKETCKLIQSLVSKITIHSRPRTEVDVIAGKPPKNLQMIPDGIDIELKLPQEMIVELQKIRFSPTGGFVVKKGDVWVSRDSNPGHKA